MDQTTPHADAVAAAVRVEREACARLVETWSVDRARFVVEGPRAVVAELARIAAALRGRGDQPDPYGAQPAPVANPFDE